MSVVVEVIHRSSATPQVVGPGARKQQHLDRSPGSKAFGSCGVSSLD